MEQLVILLVIGAISLINWLLQKSAEHRRELARRGGEGGVEPERPVVAEPAAPPEDDWRAPETELRKFLEALGLPQETVPPPQIPPPIPRPAPPPVSKAFVEPVAAPPPSRRSRRLSETPAEMRELASRFQKQTKEQPAPQAAPAGFRRFLQSPSGLREAIVLREILGPPRGFDSL